MTAQSHRKLTVTRPPYYRHVKPVCKPLKRSTTAPYIAAATSHRWQLSLPSQGRSLPSRQCTLGAAPHDRLCTPRRAHICPGI